MGKYIIRVKIMLNSNIVSGFVNRNKHGKYYPSAAHSMIFDNLITALLALEQLKESYGILGYDIKNISDDITLDINNLVIGNLDTLKLVLRDIIKFKLSPVIDCTSLQFKFNYSEDINEVTIRWMNNELKVNPKLNHFIPNDICWSPFSSSTALVTYDQELLIDLVTTIRLFLTGNSLEVVLDKYNINIDQL